MYDYQANMAPVGTIDTGEQTERHSGALPMRSRGLPDARLDQRQHIGLRIYDISTGRAQVIPSETKIKIGNSNR